MITLELTPKQISDMEALEDGEQIEIDYHGLPCFIVYAPSYGDVEINRRKYTLGFFNPPEWEIKESKLVNVEWFFTQNGVPCGGGGTFQCYKCHLRQHIRALSKYVKEHYPMFKYRYVVTDEQGRLVK